MKLNKIINITGTIQLITGLHIGAGKDNIEIGGLDLPIMKQPNTKAPYIPGSSLKGKMRSLLEVTQLGLGQYKPRINEKGEPCGCGDDNCLICTIFGVHKASQEKAKVTRLLVRDSLLNDDFMEKHKNGNLPMEIKYENTINRVKGIADNPRPVERVPAGTEFTFNIALKIYENDREEDFIRVIKTGLKLLELDAIGGHSSRGSGQIKFKDLVCDNSDFTLPATLDF